MVTKAQSYQVRIRDEVRGRISELPDRQQSILLDLIGELAENPGEKGKPTRGEANKRVISRGGYRAVYSLDGQRREVQVEAVTAPLASVVGDAMSVWDLPRFEKLREQPLGSPVDLTREEALAIATEAFASRPDLPPGDEYVRRLRPIWRGLLKNRDG